jgi:hypothetical protein
MARAQMVEERGSENIERLPVQNLRLDAERASPFCSPCAYTP